MLDPVSIWREGGPFMFPLLACATAALPMFLLAFGTTLFRIRLVSSALLGLVAVPLLLGLLGTWSGFDLAQQAMSNASLEMKARMASNGMSVGLYTLFGGAFLSGLGGGGLAFIMGLANAISPKVEKRWTLGHGGVGPLLALFAIVFIALGSYASGLVALLSGLGIFMGSLRFPVDGESVDAARMAGTRSMIGLASMLGLGSMVVYLGGVALSSLAGIRTNASQDIAQVMMSATTTSLLIQLGLLGLALLLAALGLLVSVGLVRRSTPVKGGIIAALLPGLLWAPVVLLFVPVSLAASSLWSMSAPFSEVRAPLIEAAGIELPVYKGYTSRLSAAVVLQFSKNGVTLDGKMAEAGRIETLADKDPSLYVGVNAHVLVEADASTPLADVIPFVDTLTKGNTRWMVQGLSAISLHVSTEQPESGFGVVVDQELVQIRSIETVWIEEERFESTSDLKAIDRLSEVHIWMSKGTVEDLLGVVAALRGREHSILKVTWHPIESPLRPVNTKETAEDKGIPFDVRGSLPKAIIRRVIRRAKAGIRICYQQQLLKNPSLDGEVKMRIVVSPNGKVAKASVLESSLKNDAVETCIAERLEALSFPEPPGGGIVMITYPFVFAR